MARPLPLLPRLLLAALLAAGIAGCSSPYQKGLPPSMVGRPLPPGLQPLADRMAADGERNWVLHLTTMAVAALQFGDRETAKAALDEAILQIEVIYGDSDQARRARSLFYSEGSKIYKGDPHERSMTYFYRGVLYMQEAEWDNARACFRSALVMDSFAEDEQSQADWTTFHYLIGVCETQLRRPSHANDAFTLAANAFGAFPTRFQSVSKTPLPTDDEGLMPFTPESNLLIISQSGRAPIKIGSGEFGERLSYRHGGAPDRLPVLEIDGKALGAIQTVDSLFYQAVTRGGRELDYILGKQASFKGTTRDVGNVALVGGAVLLAEGLSSDNDGMAAAGGALVAAGALSHGLSALTRPRADTRSWRSIPEWIGLRPATVEPGVREVVIAHAMGTRVIARVDVPPPGKGLQVLLAFPPPHPFILANVEQSSPADGPLEVDAPPPAIAASPPGEGPAPPAAVAESNPEPTP